MNANIFTRKAEDGYDTYYAEKIWQLIPGIYRDEDQRAVTPGENGPLQALADVLGEAVAQSRRSVDRIWADQGIIDCDDWAIPYIAELLGTRLVSEQNTAGRRADVFNTIRYRRKAGTVALLALLADDIAGWDAVPQEAFKRLTRTWHPLDCPAPLGAISETPQHGIAQLRHARVGEAAYGAFDDVSHMPDFRQLRGRDGRFNIPKVNLHIFRQSAFELNGVTPHGFGENLYTLDPSGRDIPLFIPGQPSADGCTTGEEWQIRQPLTCRLFNDGRYDVTGPVIGAVGLDALLPLEGVAFRTAAELTDRASALKSQHPLTPGVNLTNAQAVTLIEAALRVASNRAHFFDQGVIELAPGPVPTSPHSPARLFGGNLGNWANALPATEPWVRALVDPETGRVVTQQPLFSRRYYEGRFWPVGAGSHERGGGLAEAAISLPDPVNLHPADPGPEPDFAFPVAGVHQVEDSQTYMYEDPPSLTLEDDLVVQAANRERPYILIEALPGDDGRARFVIDGPDGAALTLDGLWLGMLQTDQGAYVLGANEGPEDAPPLPAEIVIAGDFSTVTLRNMTLDPGGIRAQTNAGQVFVLPFVGLTIEGQVDEVVIERSVIGPVAEASGANALCSAARITIRDSIVVGNSIAPAFSGWLASLDMRRSTVFGDIAAARYFIEDSLIEGTVVAEDAQGSCIRYSAAHVHPVAGLAGAYRCAHFDPALPQGLFVSRRFGDPGFAQLGELAPMSIRRGAENSSEMGVYNCALDPIKRDDLVHKLSEFTTINTLTQLVFET